jgi:hypothetical protein
MCMGPTNEQQRQFNDWPISDLCGEVDYIQISLNLFFKWNVVSVSELRLWCYLTLSRGVYALLVPSPFSLFCILI